MAKPKKDPQETWATIKIHRTTYNRVIKLLGKLRVSGWSGIASTRTEQPTISRLIDEAVGRLEV